MISQLTQYALPCWYTFKDSGMSPSPMAILLILDVISLAAVGNGNTSLLMVAYVIFLEINCRSPTRLIGLVERVLVGIDGTDRLVLSFPSNSDNAEYDLGGSNVVIEPNIGRGVSFSSSAPCVLPLFRPLLTGVVKSVF